MPCVAFAGLDGTNLLLNVSVNVYEPTAAYVLASLCGGIMCVTVPALS